MMRRPTCPGEEYDPTPRATRRDRGASLVEYALLVALISVLCLAALHNFSDENEGLLQNSTTEIVEAGQG